MVLVDGVRPGRAPDGPASAAPAVRRAGASVLLLGAWEEPGPAPALRLSKFHAPEIVFGPDSVQEAAHAAVRLGARRPFVVTDPGLTEAGWPSELLRHLRATGLAPQLWRDVTPNPRDHEVEAGFARELHDSVTQYALSAGMHIELARTEVADARLRTHLDTAKDLTRRAVEQLRSAIYALHHGGGEAEEDLPAMLRRLSGVHMPDELRVEVRIGGEPVPLPAACEQSLFRIAGEALFNTAVHADASRAVVRLAHRGDQVRLTIADDGRGRPEEVRRSLRAASVACPSGEHRGLVNMAGRARELGGALTFRRARLGGLQVQVDIPVPAAPRRADGNGATR